MTPMIKKNDFRTMPFKGLAFFADVKRKVVKTHSNFYTSLCLFFVLENFFALISFHTQKLQFSFINAQVT